MAAKKSKSKNDNQRAGRNLPSGDNENEEGDAIEMLANDHERVAELFEEFESAKDEDEDEDDKAARVSEICLELTIHATLEEEIFYPAARAALGEEADDLLDEAEVEHDSLKSLVAQLLEEQPGDDLYDAKVKVLGEYVKHHVAEEEGELFPKLRDAEFDSESVAEEMRQRKEELRGELQEETPA